jgi:hypothetical protein
LPRSGIEPGDPDALAAATIVPNINNKVKIRMTSPMSLHDADHWGIDNRACQPGQSSATNIGPSPFLDPASVFLLTNGRPAILHDGAAETL